MTSLKLGCRISLQPDIGPNIQLVQDMPGLRSLDARRILSDYSFGVPFGPCSVFPFIGRSVTDIAKRVLRLANEFVRTGHPLYPATGLNV